MSGGRHTERRFEEAVEAALLAHGHVRGDPTAFRADLALFPTDLLAFVQASQPRKWQELEKIQGAAAAETLTTALVKELAAKGALHVLRKGFKCFGKTFDLAYFAPATGMNPDAWAAYRCNIVSVTRQVHYSPIRPALSVDMVIAVNGLPVATIELKNPMSGQRVEDARRQYEERDTKDPLFRFKERALVHFAADPDLVFMTTRLDGRDTLWLPFNRGHDNGAGNPPAEEGAYRNSYFWEQVLERDSLLDILARFLHLQVEQRAVTTAEGVRIVRKETMIFPRYHQLDCVRRLIDHAKTNGSGRNYLIQHSAGSGKSNTIAWLAHRLSSLHDGNDGRVFHSVIVITDRVVLDRQLQETIYQFDHKRGVVEKIEEDTRQLAKALSSGVPIVITTIQKFPFIAQALAALAKRKKERREEGEGQLAIDTTGKRFAVIVDEAHSSQSGEAAMELRKVLNRQGIDAAVAEQLLDMEDEALSEEAKRAILREMLKRPRQPNLSYFAFTATPKFKTKGIFDEPGPDGRPPFHLYSMRQAIEEEFILDVLEHYTTYTTFFGLIKKVEEDPDVPRRKSAKALARFLDLHPHNLGQKVEVIVEHFREHTAKRLGGRAKAMVVTASRLHAVRYKLAFDAYVKGKGYANIRSLVAFSGEVTDPDLPDRTFTESRMNGGLRETELPARFATNEFQVLLVADKYQTGFDQPLLHTMYVDKRLSGVQAVQTLSRLNRKAPGKTDTFILDFVNDTDEIFRAFKPYFEKTPTGPMPDPHQLDKLQHKLMESGVIDADEVDRFCEIWFGSHNLELTHGEHRRLHTLQGAAVERFRSLVPESQDDFKKLLTSFRNLYAFLSQIIPYQDSGLEKLYVYGRYLYPRLIEGRDISNFRVEDSVALKYYRLQRIGEVAINLKAGNPVPLKGPTDVGTGRAGDEDVPLSELVDALNDRLGTEFKTADQLFLQQVGMAAMANEMLREVRRVNKPQDFKRVFRRMLEGMMLGRLEGNEEFVERVLGDAQAFSLAVDWLSDWVYSNLEREEADKLEDAATGNIG